MSRAHFIYNNLMVSPFLLSDAPLPGFDLLTHQNESRTHGTLWDIGNDAGMTLIGNGFVKGQVWIAEDMKAIEELEMFMGVHQGLKEKKVVEVSIEVDGIQDIIKATTYCLTEIKPTYNIINDGHWLIKRYRM